MKPEALQYLWYTLLGYISGSVLFALIIPKYLFHTDVTESSEDHNPGVFNVCTQVGMTEGILVLVLELAKGFLPVWAASRHLLHDNWLFGLVLAAPVLGHAFPFWRIRGGGKAIAVSFGALLGLYPNWQALGFLIICYLFFTMIVVVEPHLHCSVITYGCVSLLTVLFLSQKGVVLGVLLISFIVILRHLMKYQGEKLTIHLGPKSRKSEEASEEKREI